MAVNWDAIEGFSKKEFAPPVKPDHEWEMHPGIMDALSSIRRLGIYKYKEFRILIHTNGGYSVDGLHPNWNQQGFHLDYRLGIKGGAVWWDRGGKYKTYGHQSFGDAVMDVLYYEFKKQDAGV